MIEWGASAARRGLGNVETEAVMVPDEPAYIFQPLTPEQLAAYEQDATYAQDTTEIQASQPVTSEVLELEPVVMTSEALAAPMPTASPALPAAPAPAPSTGGNVFVFPGAWQGLPPSAPGSVAGPAPASESSSGLYLVGALAAAAGLTAIGVAVARRKKRRAAR